MLVALSFHRFNRRELWSKAEFKWISENTSPPTLKLCTHYKQHIVAVWEKIYSSTAVIYCSQWLQRTLGKQRKWDGLLIATQFALSTLNREQSSVLSKCLFGKLTTWNSLKGTGHQKMNVVFLLINTKGKIWDGRLQSPFTSIARFPYNGSEWRPRLYIRFCVAPKTWCLRVSK